MPPRVNRRLANARKAIQERTRQKRVIKRLPLDEVEAIATGLAIDKVINMHEYPTYYACRRRLPKQTFLTAIRGVRPKNIYNPKPYLTERERTSLALKKSQHRMKKGKSTSTKL